MKALITGAILCIFIGGGEIHNLVKIKGSYMTLDFTTGFAIFFIFFITLFNYLFKKIFKKQIFSSSELAIIYIMMIVACAIPTMGFVLYFVPLIVGIKYLSNPLNEWSTLILPHIKKNLIIQDAQAVKWFYEGLPPGEKIPWNVWIKPLLLWILLILAIYFAMIFIMVLLHKQWSHNERLNYPMTKAPLALINAENNRIFKNSIFWCGFLIPFTIGLIKGFHFYFPIIPDISLGTQFSIFRKTVYFPVRISFPMIGFMYFSSLTFSFSLWFFFLLSAIQTGILNITGAGSFEFLPYSDEMPIIAWQSTGALIILVLYGIWVSRSHLLNIIKNRDIEKDYAIIPTKIAFRGLLLSFLIIYLWLLYSGFSYLPAMLFMFFAFLIYIGITRGICEGGIAVTRAPIIPSVAVNSLLGSANLGPNNLIALGLTFPYSSDMRTFVMASVANGLKIAEDIKRKKVIVFWAIIIAILFTLFASLSTTIFYSYRYGGINADSWFWIDAPQYPLKYLADKIKNPHGPQWSYIKFISIGAISMMFLIVMKTRFLSFPFHPLGYAFSTITMTGTLWFSVFITWLIKVLILRYGGAKVYEKMKPLFIGLVVGQFVISGLFIIIDLFTGSVGNRIFSV